jgi:LPXTG-site transpeptidase (sortase) family protein
MRKMKTATVTKVVINITIVAVVVIGGYALYDTIKTNKAAKDAYSQQDSSSAQEVRDETTIEPTAIDSYAVSPDKPRTIEIQKINAKARVLPVGVNNKSEIATPTNINDTGWYISSSKPKERGQTLIVGHVSGPTAHGIFYDLPKLVTGDTITVEQGDKSKVNYTVTETKTMPAKDVTETMLLASGESKHGLTLVTCTGPLNKQTNTFPDRFIVIAKET